MYKHNVMKSLSFFQRLLRIFGLAVVLMVCWPQSASAQLVPKWLDVGELHEYYIRPGVAWMDYNADYGGAWYTGMQWPAVYPYNDHKNVAALYIGARDFTDEEGRHFDYKVVTQKTQEIGQGGVIPIDHRLISRFPPPEVTVDGAESFRHANFVDEVDPELPSDRMVVTTVNTQLGLTMTRKDMAWSQEHHDNYHLTEFTFENTGNVDEDDEIELPETTLEEVFITRYDRTSLGKAGNSIEGAGANWGRYDMHDAIGFGARDFTDELGPEYRGQFDWDPNDPHFTQWDDLGSPAINDNGSLIAEGDSMGRITAPGFHGRLVVHADRSATEKEDDPSQPTTMAHISGNHELLGNEDPFSREYQRREYEFMTQGRTAPHHADVVVPPREGESWADQMARQGGDPSLGPSSGQHYIFGYGPYTLEPGQEINIVVAHAVDGLDREATIEIGNQFKDAYLAGEEDRPISYDANGNGEIDADEVMSKNHWVLTGRDSIFQTYRRAMANYRSGYEIPRDPLPPSEFHVNSGADQIALEWDVYPEANPQRFEIWRADGEPRLWEFEKIAELDPSTRTYEDTEVTRGVGYYYHILSVGDENTDDTGLTPTGKPLKSSLYYTQTWDPATLRRDPGENIEAARVVPNPFDLGADRETIRWTDPEDRIAFLNIPGRATIRIYTEMGELVETVEHTDGSGDEFWDLTTSSGQMIASGVYLAVIEDNDTGEQVVRKFVIVR
jgi:hypothetical protein